MDKKHKILVVEDTKTIANLLSQVLEEAGYDIRLAVDGEEALVKAQEFLPDVILLDIMIPKLDGFEVCKILKAISETCEIPVIFLTGKGESDDIVKGFHLGAVDYIVKPFEETVLLARIETHVQLKKHREELEAANLKLEELNITKDKFFSIIAHDLRSPFTALMGFSRHLYESTDSLSKEDIITFSRHIFEASEKAYALLENLLKWAQTQMGTIVVSQEKVDLYILSMEVFELLAANAAKKQIHLVNEIKKDSFVTVDKNMIYTILRNLVNNAIKFTSAGGEVKLVFKQDAHFAEIAVSDTGVGISEEDIKTLFKLDKCISHAGTEGEKGTGLGLILCKEFAQKNGGDIVVASELGKGAVFTVSFPVSK